MQVQRSQGLDTIIAKVNSVFSREVTLPAAHDPLTGARPGYRVPAATVYIPQPNRPETVAVETPWGYFLPIARVEVGGASVSHDKIMGTKNALQLRLGVSVSFEPTPGGGPLQLWVPKAEPDPAYFFNAYNAAQLGPLSGVIGVDRWNRPVVVDLYQGVDRHVVILGPTTAGKSVIADMFLLSMCLRTAPEMMRLVIFDCKSKAHEPWLGMPHLALYEGGGERNKTRILAGISALERMMDERLETGVSSPVVVALFDDGRMPEGWASAEYRATMGRLLAIGASAGIRIIITTHELSKEWAGDAGRSNLNTRIVSGNDVTMTASQVGRGGSAAHMVDQTLRQFVLMQNNQVRTFYAPHLCQAGKFLDLNRNGRDDVLDAIETCQRRYELLPMPELRNAVVQANGPRPTYAVTAKPERTVNGVTFSDAVETIVDLLESNPDAIQADIAEALWGTRRINGNAQVTFLKEAITEARKEVENVTTD